MNVQQHLPCDNVLRVVEMPERRNDGTSRRQTLGSRMLSERAWAEIARSLSLSACELLVVRGVFDDCLELIIAADLGISPLTVHTDIESLLHKLAVADRGELILRVTDQFLALTASPQSVLPSICANRTAGRCPLRRD